MNISPLHRPNNAVLSLLGLLSCLCLAGWAAEALGKIESGAPRYLQKNHEAWASRGRIVGVAKEAPPFTVTVLDSAKKTVTKVQAEAGKNGRRVYEAWLPPGVYTILVQATGYAPYDRHSLEVRKGADLRLDLEFTPAAAD